MSTHWTYFLAAVEEAESGGITLTHVLVVIFALVALALFMEHRGRRKEQKRIIEERWRQFSNELDLFSPTSEEKNLLVEIAKESDLERPVDMIRVRRILDDCVNRKIRLLKSKKVAPDSLKGVARTLGSVRRKLSLDVLPGGFPLLSTRGVSAGQPLIVRLIVKPPQVFESEILEADDLEIVIQGPADEAMRKALRPGSVVLVELSRENDARYRFEAPVIRIEAKGTGRVYLEHTTEVERYQSREFFRAMMLEPVFFYPLTEGQFKQFQGLEKPVQDSLLLKMGLQEISGEASTISGGGIAIVSPEKLAVDQPLLITMDPYLEKPVGPIPARICSVSSLPGKRYLLRASFEELEDTVRDTIINYVSRLQIQTDAGESSPPDQSERSSSPEKSSGEKVPHA